jgi:hypothetical protein
MFDILRSSFVPYRKGSTRGDGKVNPALDRSERGWEGFRDYDRCWESVT